VTFNNQEGTIHSYTFGKDHEDPLHEISFVPARDEIMVQDFEEGTVREVEMHDGSTIILKKLEADYDPTDRWQALRCLQEAQEKNWLVTGLLYFNPEPPSIYDLFNLPDEPLNRMKEEQLRPAKSVLTEINKSLR
jgi:2-oxoglutarate ferredoxin oxidoreductase subunit beta